MAKSQEQIIAEQAKDITRLKQIVIRLEQALRQTERKAVRANEGVRMLRNDMQNLHRMKG
jgi:hypothetical protein